MAVDGEVKVKLKHTDRFHAWFNSWSEAEPESEGGDSGLRMGEEGRTVQ